jgi:hypothetical protein
MLLSNRKEGDFALEDSPSGYSDCRKMETVTAEECAAPPDAVMAVPGRIELPSPP